MARTKQEARDGDDSRLRAAMSEVVTAGSHLAEKIAAAQHQLEAWASMSGHSQKALAAAAGYSAQFVSDLVHRRRSLTYEMAGRILAALEKDSKRQ